MYQGLRRSQLTATSHLTVLYKKEFSGISQCYSPGALCEVVNLHCFQIRPMHSTSAVVTFAEGNSHMCDAGRDAMWPQPQLPVSSTCPVQTHLQHVEQLLSDVSLNSFAFALLESLLQSFQGHQKQFWFQHPYVAKLRAIVKCQSLVAGLWPWTGIFVCECSNRESQFCI